MVIRYLKKIFTRSNHDPALTESLLNLANGALIILLLISVVGMPGIETASFIAILGAAGLAIGLALQCQRLEFKF